ncbi:FxsA family protein [Pseudomonas sp. Marseille-QA0892]
MRFFFLLFLLFPVIELAVLIKVGSMIGVLATLLLIVVSAIVGAGLLRFAGVATALRARERLARGELPDREMLEGLMVAIGGLLLMLPGFISDVAGLFCLLPFTRGLVIDRLKQRADAQTVRQRAFQDDPQPHRGNARPNVIEGEYEKRDQ